MATKSHVARSKKLNQKLERAIQDGRKMKFATRVFHVCSVCGRTRGYLGNFDICRICFREKANTGELPGVRKSSW